MSVQTIQTGAGPQCHLTGGRADLEVLVGDGRSMIVDSKSDLVVEQSEAAYLLNGWTEPLRVQLPHDAIVQIRDNEGAIKIRGVGSVVVETARGDIMIEGAQHSVTLRDLTGDLVVRDCAALVLKDGPKKGRFDERRGVENVTLERVAQVEIENVGCDLSLSDAQQVKVNNVGAQGRLRDVSGDLTIENIGGSCTIERVGGTLKLSNVGGSATFVNIGSVERLGNIGGSLTLRSAPFTLVASATPLHIAVGGSATVELPANANLEIEAMVGGGISGPGLALSGPGMHRVVYGEGSTKLHMVAGGNIELRGGGTPQATGSSWGRWAQFGAEIGRSVVAAANGKHSKRNEAQARAVGAKTDRDEQRRAILQRVAQGEISPADADSLLESI